MRRFLRILCGLMGTSIAIGVGVVVGAIGWAHLPEPKLGVVVGVVAGIATSAIVIRLWSWRVTRALVVLATVAHVGYWSWLGFQELGARDAVPTEPRTEVVGWSASTAFTAGHARVPFDLPVDAPLGGWGSGPRRQALPAFGGLGPLGRMSLQYMAAPTDDSTYRQPLLSSVGEAGPTGNPVGAGAVVLRANAQPPIAIVTLDTVTVDADLTDAIALGVRDLGITAPALLVCATHTHSGPGGYSKQPLSQILGTGHFHEETFNALVHSAVAAVRTAFAGSRPARIAIVRSRDHDGKEPVLTLNRRRDDNRIDDRVVGLRLDEADGTPMALVLNYAVHPVVFRRRHPFADRDLVGAIEREVGAVLGAPVLFINGALGDVSPKATPGHIGAERCSVLARQFAKTIAGDVRDATAHEHLHVAAARRGLDLGTPLGVMAWGDRAAITQAARQGFGGGSLGGWVADLTTLPLNAFVWSLGLPEVRLVARFGEGVGIAANVRQMVGRTEFAMGSLLFTVGTDGERLALLWQPAEATQAVGRTIKSDAAPYAADVMLAGLANGACAYLTSPDEYARRSYEARATLFGAQATRAVQELLTTTLQLARQDADRVLPPR